MILSAIALVWSGVSACFVSGMSFPSMRARKTSPALMWMSVAPRSTAALMIFSIRSVPLALVDHVAKRIAGQVPTPVVEKERQLPLPESHRRDGGYVRSEQHRSKLPQPTVARQWLG